MCGLLQVSRMSWDWWDWEGEEPPQARYKGRIVKWHSKDQGSEQLIIAWELGMMAGVMQQE